MTSLTHRSSSMKQFRLLFFLNKYNLLTWAESQLKFIQSLTSREKFGSPSPWCVVSCVSQGKRLWAPSAQWQYSKDCAQHVSAVGHYYSAAEAGCKQARESDFPSLRKKKVEQQIKISFSFNILLHITPWMVGFLRILMRNLTIPF